MKQWVGASLGLAMCLQWASPGEGEPIDWRVEVKGGYLNVSVAGAPSVDKAALYCWIDDAVRGVTAYLGRFPVPQARLLVRTGTGHSVGHGVTYGGPAPSIRITVGLEADRSDLRRDWVLTHEMLHLAFPDLTSDDAWAGEGLSTYAEPLARERAGTLTEDQIWAGLVDGLPQGLPGRGDRGLHGTRAWGRTYWGGALFWLLADIELRERTDNRKGLPDALGAILGAGGDIRAEWSLRRTLTIADQALHVTVLSDLYDRLGTAPGEVSLTDLWQRLGVSVTNGRVTYARDAPLASVRRAITGQPLDAGVAKGCLESAATTQP